jgi:hypothetical protein
MWYEQGINPRAACHIWRPISTTAILTPRWCISPLRKNCSSTPISAFEHLKLKSYKLSRNLINAEHHLPTLPKLFHAFFHEWLVEQRMPLIGRYWRIAMHGGYFSDLSLNIETSQ